jgi:hypothetical protein
MKKTLMMKNANIFAVIGIVLIAMLLVGCMSGGTFVKDFMDKGTTPNEHAYVVLAPGFTVQNYDGTELFQVVGIGHRPWGSGTLVDDIAVLTPGEHTLIVTHNSANYGRIKLSVDLLPAHIYEIRYTTSDNTIRFITTDHTINTSKTWVDRREKIAKSFGVSWGSHDKDIAREMLADGSEELRIFCDGIIKAVYYTNDLIGLTIDEVEEKVISDRSLVNVIANFREMTPHFNEGKVSSVEIPFGQYNETIEYAILVALQSEFGSKDQQEDVVGIGTWHKWSKDTPPELESIDYIKGNDNKMSMYCYGK